MYYTRRALEKDTPDLWAPPLRWAFLEGKTALLATFALAYIWFSRCVPALQPIVAAVAPSSPAVPSFSLGARDSFALLSAGVHTLLVGLGFAAGKDTLLASGAVDFSRIGRVLCSVVFCVLALLLGVSFDYQLEPVHSYAKIFYTSALPFSLIGAFSVTLWLAVSMLFPHLRVGHRFKGSTGLHAGLIALAGAAHVVDVHGEACLSGFGCLAAATLFVESADTRRVRNLSSL